jgi:uncharacterized protein YidB (DUF937 family)
MTMDDLSKLSTLLDDPETRVLIFGLAHVGSAPPAAPGPARLHAVVLRLADATTADQYGSWLSDATPNQAMTVDQVQLAFSDAALDDLAQWAGSSPGEVTWQLAAALPDLVDAISPDGVLIDVDRLARAIAQVTADDDRSAGAFGPRLY